MMQRCKQTSKRDASEQVLNQSRDNVSNSECIRLVQPTKRKVNREKNKTRKGEISKVSCKDVKKDVKR